MNAIHRMHHIHHTTGINMKTVLQEVEKLSMPSWPLQNAVAVNPFWNFRDKKFHEVLSELSPVLHTGLFMPLEYYLGEYRDGRIHRGALAAAIAEAREHWPDLPGDVEAFLRASSSEENLARRIRDFAEHLDNGHGDGAWRRAVIDAVGRYAAAFYDDRQALAGFARPGVSLWQAWLAAQRYDRAMDELGARGFGEALKSLDDSQADAAITRMLAEMQIQTTGGQVAYLQRLLAGILGWASRVQYDAWQNQLNGQYRISAQLPELLAIRLAYDYGLFQSSGGLQSGRRLAEWVTAINEYEPAADDGYGFRLHQVWLRAQEASYQQRLARSLTNNGPSVSTAQRVRARLAFCIDVRSEMFRRNLEAVDGEVETIGFAGFFGLPFAYQRRDGKQEEPRLPVLLAPGLQVQERRQGRGISQLNESFLRSYFRNLRKLPFASFLYVELFGLLSVENLIRRTLFSLLRRLRRRFRLPARFDDGGRGPDLQSLCDAHGHNLDAKGRAELVARIWKGMGLPEDNPGELVVFVGHGSETVNNAFGSALDCGACGGHAGDMSARLLARLLNDPAVRAELAGQGLPVKDSTHFLAAVHETVTDRVFFLDEAAVPASHEAELQRLRESLDLASRATRRERQGAVSDVVDRHVYRRARNWAEVRPEWGLTGNAAFIVAPRSRTRGTNLASRVFLHEYDFRRDDGFALLTQILTAPMVVTNWINLQYYASTVANNVYGSGNKVLHNLVNESGVLEGNGGDLRVGLPWQSIHDGERFAHEPVRLSVFVEAPREAIETIIAAQPVVRDLIENEWLYLLHIEPDSGTIALRQSGGRYRILPAS